MSKNVGKIFEEDFIKSVPNNIFHFRFRDLPYFLVKNSQYKVNNNPADFLVFYKNLFILELKSCNTTSYSINNTRQNQVDGLLKYSKIENVICGFIINMRKYNKTYFLSINDYLLITNNKKSINLKDLNTYGILIEQELKRTRFKYEVLKFFDRFI